MASENINSKHVCVIGAGPSGLVSARELRKEGHSVVVLEQNYDVGGQWLYEPNIEKEDALGRNTPLKVHSSVYASLRLIAPREIIGYTDFPFHSKKGRDMRRFPGHAELLSYLRDFSQWFRLREMIRFNTRVEYVGMMNASEFRNLKWIVRSKELERGTVKEEIFDAVVVANGQYSKPRLPSIKGMDTWTRKQIHSHVYRVPEPFRNEVVVVVGNSVSGQDITLELVRVAKEVHISAKSLDISEGLSKVINKYQNLHIHLQIIGFSFFESQAMWIAQVLSGKRKLPSGDTMMRAVTEFYRSKDDAGIPKHNTHDLADLEYCDRYGDNCGFPHLEEWRKELCLYALKNAGTNLESYRDIYEDHELLQEAYQSPHFMQLDPDVIII